MTDTEIVGLFLNRDEKAISETEKLYGAYCRYVAMNLLGSREDADECVNDALNAAWNSIPPNEPENLRTYLGKLTREISIDRLRKMNRQKRLAPGMTFPLNELEETVSLTDAGDELDEKELSRAISAFLYSLDVTKRNIFIRRYWYCDPVENICRMYGFGHSRVLMTLKRTRDALAAYLRKEGFIQ